MKGFASTAFFRLFDRAVRPADPTKSEARWSVDGVAWRRERHSYNGADYQFATDVFTGLKPGKHGWAVMVVREGWWASGKSDPIRTHQWAHLMSGSRADALAWFAAQEAGAVENLTRRRASE